MKSIRKHISALLVLLMVVGLFAGCSQQTEQPMQTQEAFANAKIGVLTGSTFDQLAQKYLPNAERLLFMNMSDLLLNMEQNRIDGILMDGGFFAPLAWENQHLSAVEMDMPPVEYGIAFSKGEQADTLVAQMNEFIRKQTENGWLAAQSEKWFSSSQPDGSLDLSQLTGENGTLRIATSIECKPFAFLKDEQICGYDADFIFRFAMEYGYALDIDTMDFGALLPSINAERYDLAFAGITVTEERRESVRFSDIYCSNAIVMAVHGETASESCACSLEDYATAKIGIITGSAHDETAKRMFPNAKRVYFSTMADMMLAVEQGKIDCYLEDATFVTPLIWEGINLKCLDAPVTQISNGFVFPQAESSRALRETVNAFLAEAKADGTIDRFWEKWHASTEPTEHSYYENLTGENGTIRLALALDGKPLLYQSGERYTGFEIDLLTAFGQKCGYNFEIEVVPFESIIAGIAAGKYDMAAACLNITEEREESVDFSDPYRLLDVVLVVKGEGEQQLAVTVEELQTGKIAVLTGTIWDGVAQSAFPNAERKYFSSMTDMTLALEQGKVDAILGDKTFYVNARWENVPVAILDDTIGSISCGLMLAKDTYDPVLLEQLNAFIALSEQNGTLDRLYQKWLSDAEPTEHPDYHSLTGENGTLKIAVDSTAKPMTYQRGNEFTGYDVDLLTAFANAYGYRLEFEGMAFSALIPTVASEKCDIGACGIAITAERAQSVTYTDAYEEIEGVAIVSGTAARETEKDFWEKTAASFEKTFIREARWKLIVKGIGVTMLISICAAIAGSLLGFGLYMLSRSDVKLLQALAKGVAKVYSRIIAGTPVVVILMILFYVVFGKIRDMSGIVVAIIGFALTFGAFVYDHMTVSVNSVDRGQLEAAYSLGYPKNKAFFRVIFPQAMTIFLPSYCGQAVELIKATAVVGYIAVNDLTKMGDIIRSNTYEAFFPLIATAVIYFLLTWMLSLLLNLVKMRFEPKRRSAEMILKGVKTK